MLQSCVYIDFRFFDGVTKYEKQKAESNICKN